MNGEFRLSSWKSRTVCVNVMDHYQFPQQNIVNTTGATDLIGTPTNLPAGVTASWSSECDHGFWLPQQHRVHLTTAFH